MKHEFKITFELDSQEATIDNCVVERDEQTTNRIIGAFPISDMMDWIKHIVAESLEW